jgi:hypothetical protein
MKTFLRLLALSAAAGTLLAGRRYPLGREWKR